MTGKIAGNSLAGTGFLAQYSGDIDGLAAGSQRLFASGSRFPRSGDQQKPARYPHLSAAGCQLPAVGGRTDFDSLFTRDKPVIFNFHGYPWLIHKLVYRRANHKIHVRGYKEQGNINTPMELAIRNQIDRFNLVIDAIDRVPDLYVAGAHVKERMKNKILECQRFAHTEGYDKPEFSDWCWLGK